MENIINFLKEFKEIGPWIISMIAILQVWLIELGKFLYKKYYDVGQIDIHKIGNIEIGYGPIGPTITLHGIFRCLNKDIFIANTKISLTRVRTTGVAGGLLSPKRARILALLK